MQNIGEDKPLFLRTEVRPVSESSEKFRLRRLYEEFNFFGSLVEPKNQDTRIELTNTARKVTRTLSQYTNYYLGSYSPLTNLPNNTYCFSGLFGYQATANATRYVTGADANKEFVDGLDKHLEELSLYAQEAAKETRAQEGLLLAIHRCAQGITSFVESYGRKAKHPQSPEKLKDYNYLAKTLKKRVDSLEAISNSFLATPFYMTQSTIFNSNDFQSFIQDEGDDPFKQSTIFEFNDVRFGSLPQSIICEPHTNEITNFVEGFLHPYITGQITADESKGRTSLMDILKEHFGDTELVENQAFDTYLKAAARGLYINQGIRNNTDDVLYTPSSKEFKILVAALILALKIDFPHKKLNENEVEIQAGEALKEFNAERRSIKETIGYHGPEGYQADPRINALQTVENNNNQSWFLKEEQSWSARHKDELQDDTGKIKK